MKRIITFFLMAALALSAFSLDVYAQNSRSERQERRRQNHENWLNDMQEFNARSKEEKRAESLADSLAGAQARLAIENHSFVLQADNVSFKRGPVGYVNPTTNFIAVQGDRAVVQVVSNTMAAGPNGIGGVTLDGSISGFKVREGKKGKVTYSFDVIGTGIHAQVQIHLRPSTNRASATVTQNFDSMSLNLQGEVFPYEESAIFEGKSR